MICLQENGENGAIEAKKGRSQAEKMGKFRYMYRRIERVEAEVRRLRVEVISHLEVVLNKLDPLLDQVSSDFVVDVVCEDEADVFLVDYMRSKGDGGITPSEASAAVELKRFRFKPYHVTRRVQRMNERLRKKLGKNFAESYMRRWVLTSFVERSFGLSKEEVVEEPLEEDLEEEDLGF